MGVFERRNPQLQSHEDCCLSHPSLSLLLEAAAVLPDSLFPCVSLAVSVSGSDGGFFLSFLSFLLKNVTFGSLKLKWISVFLILIIDKWSLRDRDEAWHD